MKELERLTLWASSVPSFGLQFLADKTSMTHLELDYNPIDDEGLAFLKDLHELEVLWLRGSTISDEGTKVLLNFPKLRKLSLGLGEDVRTDKMIDNIVQLKNLEQLDIQWTSVTPQGVQRLEALPALRQLDIDAGDISLTMANSIAGLSQIRFLNLGFSREDVTVEQLQWLQRCTQLEKLNLHQHKIGEEFIPVLSGFTFLSQLTLWGPNVTPQVKQALRLALPNTEVR